MPKPIIAIDIDDVLAASTEAMRLEVNKRLGVELTAEHYKIPHDNYWGYYEHVWEQNDIKDKITLDELDPQMKEDQSHIQPYTDAQLVLTELAKKYELAVVTGRGLDWADATHLWLEHHFPGMFEKVLIGGGKAGLSKKDKGELCAELGAAWLIDDNAEHAQAAQSRGVQVILFGDYGWHKTAPKDIPRCRDWQAIQRYFDGISQRDLKQDR